MERVAKCFVKTLLVCIPAAIPCFSGAQSSNPVLSATAEVDRDRIFHHETFDLTFFVYSTGVRLGKRLHLMSLPQKSKLRLDNFRELPVERKIRENQTCEVRGYRCEARAMSPGIIEVSPTLRVAILTRRRLFIGSTWQETPYDIRVKPLMLSVSPLPETGKPDDFSGAVGRFSFDVEVIPSNVAVGDLVAVVMRIRGKGYLEEISPPSVSPGRHFKVYDSRPLPERGEEVRAFKQIVVPESTNAVEISAISFSFFDPRTGTYKTITKGPFPLTFRRHKTPTFERYRPATPTRDGTGPTGRPPTLSEPTSSGNLMPVAIIAYWTAAVMVALWLSLRRKRKIVAAVAIALMSFPVFFPYRTLVRNTLSGKEQIEITRNEKARFAPSQGAVVSFECPQGSIVRVLETYGNWAKIALGEKRGWVPGDALVGTNQPSSKETDDVQH